MTTKLSPDLAIDKLLELPVSPSVESVPLQHAYGRVLAQDVFITIPAPPFDRSPFDGYALRGEDTAHASKASPVTLRITEEIPAGKVPTMAVAPGEAAKILTGAPVPDGANTVVKYEDTEFTIENVKIFQPVRPDTNIVRRGEDTAEGSLAAAKGSVICAATAGVLASQGLGEVTVFKKPLVGIINTGTELLEPGQAQESAKIYNSNFYSVGGYLKAMGTDVVNGGTVADDPDLIAARIKEAFESCSMVVTTGGASVGDYDWAVTAAQKLGAEILFWKVSMKPGGSILAASCGGKLLLGLSGNPGAALLGLLRIALPYVRKLCGREDLLLESIQVFLTDDLKKDSPGLRLLRGRLEIKAGRATFVQMDGQGNGIMSSFIGCDLIGQIPAGSPPLDAGTEISALVVKL